jgi:hypothetical protein
VANSIKRVAQLTGENTLNDLSQWSAKGVDLGANVIHGNDTYIFFGDTTLREYANDPHVFPAWDADLIARTDATQLGPGGFTIKATTFGSSNRYWPYTVDKLGPLGNVETPTGAFSFDGRCYVFSVGHSFRPISYLTSSAEPDRDKPFQLDYEFSRRKFMQIAPWVIDNAEHPGMPATTGNAVVMIGHGDYPEGMHLAWMPLEKGQSPEKRRLLFFSGNKGREVFWSPNENDALPVFDRPPIGYTSVSLGWLRGAEKWILVYVKGKGPGDPNPHRDPLGPIVARLSSDLFNWSPEVAIFDPVEDFALKELMGWDNNESWAYGGFLLDRFQSWNEDLGRATIVFLMSLFKPYQVQLMKCQLAIA